MKDTALSTRYAKAYIGLASDRGDVTQAVSGAQDALSFLDDFPQVRDALFSPLVPSRDKAKAVVAAMQGAIPSVAADFVAFVIEKGRADDLPEVLRQVAALYEQMQGIRHAQVYSAVPLNDKQASELADKLKALTGAEQIVLERTVDAGLIGGIRVKVGDMVWDGSLAGRLEQIKEKYL